MEALIKLKNAKADMVLLDIELPGMNGILLRTISHRMGNQDIFRLGLGAALTLGGVALARYWIDRRRLLRVKRHGAPDERGEKPQVPSGSFTAPVMPRSVRLLPGAGKPQREIHAAGRGGDDEENSHI